MTRASALVAVALACATGCFLLHKQKPGRLAPPTFSQYHLPGWEWERVDRVLVLPFLNESEYTRAGGEVRAAFTSELQRLGLFEVVAAPPDDRAVLAAQIHRGGRFDEAAMLHLAHATKADMVVHGIITQYSLYPRPRLGLVVQAVGPEEAKVVASVDGLWDTTDACVAERCRAFYRQRARKRLPFVRNNLVVESDDGLAVDLALESPALFQRWVCHEAVLALLGFPVPNVLDPTVAPDMKTQAGVAAGAGAAAQTPGSAGAPCPPPGNVK
jgi:hypothetical protein